MPDALRDEIAATLRAQHLLVNPVVDVSVVEYRSRDVTIAGAVKTPTTIQEIGNLRLLDALSQAGGLLPEAGPEVIVEQANGSYAAAVCPPTLRRISPGAEYPDPRRRADPRAAMRARLCGRQREAAGSLSFPAICRTPPCSNCWRSAAASIPSASTKPISTARPKAAPQKTEIEIPLRRILDRKAQDVKLAANDILYVPTNGKLKASASVLNHVTGMGNTAVSAAIWAH